jgi:hypothetical protein
MASVEQQVLAAKTPREALLILARAVDALTTRPTVDSWDGWGDASEAPVPGRVPAAQRAGATEVPPERAIELLKEPDPPRELTDDDVRNWIARNYGQYPMDDSEGRAIVAQVRRDLERAGKGEVALDDFVMDDGVVQSRIDYTPRDDQHRAERYAFASQILRLQDALPAHPDGGDWAADYAQLGPMPLYIANRELLMDYPDTVKSHIIADIETYDVRVSQEVGRDLLKAPMTKDDQSPAGKLNINVDG